MIQTSRAYHAYLGLGSNQGDRLEFLNEAFRRIRRIKTVAEPVASPVYESAAHVKPGQNEEAPDFLNAVIRIQTAVEPIDLLAICLEIERSLGRTRKSERWLPRTIDIDILLVDEMSWADEQLTLPHPRIHERRFVLKPICDIDPELHVPAPFESSSADLLATCRDQSPVTLYAEVSPVTLEWLAVRRQSGNE